MEPQVYHLLKVINKANITKSRYGSMNLELSDEFLYRAITLMQGGELPPSGHLAVWIHELHPCSFSRVCCIQDPVDLLGHPGACRASFHVREDKQDAAPFVCELGRPHAEVEGTFCLEMVQVILGTGEWSGGCNLRWLWGWGGDSTRLRWGRRPITMSKLGLEGCNLCCQLVDMLFSGHGEALAQGL